jgi:hypothetical protein
MAGPLDPARLGSDQLRRRLEISPDRRLLEQDTARRERLRQRIEERRALRDPDAPHPVLPGEGPASRPGLRPTGNP